MRLKATQSACTMPFVTYIRRVVRAAESGVFGATAHRIKARCFKGFHSLIEC